MTDICVIILVGREERHIDRCIEKLSALEPQQLIVVESQHGDRTHEIASSLGVTTVWHDWPGNQAAQFEWALINLPIHSRWILRLDADEYLTEELIREIKSRLPQLPENVDGVVFKRRHIWHGKWIKKGMYPTRILRLFRTGHGRSDGKIMDEHIIVQGEVVEFDFDFVDDSLISTSEWEEKHQEYAKREAKSFLSGEKSNGHNAKLKWIYYHVLPPFIRPWLYYAKRAFIAGAYFESPEARDFTYRHALWYRRLVEREIKNLRKQQSRSLFRAVYDFIVADMATYDRIMHDPKPDADRLTK